MIQKIQFKLNGEPVTIETDRTEKLLWVLRSQFGLTGTKYGCGEGFCGSCTILVDGKSERSCTMSIGDINGKEVLTIEGLAVGGKLHPVQAAFASHDALQCGYCTPGMIMTAVGLLKDNPKPTREEIIVGMDDNFCRCGSHLKIIEAIQTAAKNMGGK